MVTRIALADNELPSLQARKGNIDLIAGAVAVKEPSQEIADAALVLAQMLTV